MNYWVTSFFLFCLLASCKEKSSSFPNTINVEGHEDYCHDCTSLFQYNDIPIECRYVQECSSRYACLTITDESLFDEYGYGVGGVYFSSSGYMIVSTYHRTYQEVIETMAHEIGHFYGLDHSTLSDNIMTQDKVYADVRTEFTQEQKDIFYEKLKKGN